MLVWLLAAVLQGGAATLAGAEGLSQARSVPIDANSVMIVGVDAQKRAVIRVVDVKTGTVRVETQGTSPRWYPQQRYVLHRRDASWYAFHVPSGRLEGPLSQLEVFERSIRFGNPLERRGTLQNVLKDSAARESAAIQSAVLDRLRSELATPLPGGTDEAELRRRRAREIEIELLLRFLGRANVSEAASLIASADIEAARGALLDFGRPSIQAVLDAWKNPRVGASAAYRPRLLETCGFRKF